MGTDYMSRELAKRGHDVHVIVTRRDNGQEHHSEEQGVKIWRLPVFPIPVLRTIFEIFLTSLKILKLKPDQLHGQAMVPCGLLSGLWGKILGCSSLMYLYGRDVTHPNRFLREICGRFAMQLNDKVLAATEHCKKNALKIYDRDIDVYYSGYHHIHCGSLMSKPLQLLFVGRLEKVKGVDVLIKALKNIDAHLTIVGEGTLKDELVRLAVELGINDRIKWLGRMENTDVLQVMSKAQVLVLPSLEEPYGVVLIEALSQGCRVVASYVGGVPEIITSEDRGLLCEPCDVKSLTLRVSEALKLGPISEEARHEVVDFYEWGHRVNELVTYYDA